MVNWLGEQDRFEPDFERFNELLIRSVAGRAHDGIHVAHDFRHTFLENPEMGKRVLFMLLKWCGEYDTNPPAGNEELQRWAGKREVAARIKTALYADLSSPEIMEGSEEDG